jgi:dTDP-4-dehydrorhamnose 3,5-epimerase
MISILDTPIQGLRILEIPTFCDSRGSFTKVFNSVAFSDARLATNFVESYYSVSAKNVIRGMHFQILPAEHTKLVHVNSGKITDVVLDIRRHSKTFGEYFKIEVASEDNILIYIPVGCAHGFLSMLDNTMVTYMQTSVYNSELDRGIKYNSFGCQWGIDHPILSTRDMGFQKFSADLEYFE